MGTYSAEKDVNFVQGLGVLILFLSKVLRNFAYISKL
jgi:hypothetical protein